MTNETQLLNAERQKAILDILYQEGTVRTTELAEILNVSVVTIRSDLRELKGLGKCELIWGGAISKVSPTHQDILFTSRTHLHSEAKQRIGKKAAEFIEMGQTIFIDAGTTTVEIIHNLPHDLEHLRVITPALNVAVATTFHPSVELVMPGGVLRNLTRSLIGTQTIRALEMFNADIVFLGSGGFSIAKGVTTSNVLEVELKRTMVNQSEKVILTADSSKYGRTLSMNVTPINKVDVVITDNKLSDVDAQALQEKGVEVFRV